jgi:hypothetical protein
LHEFRGLGCDALQNLVVLLFGGFADNDSYGGIQADAIIALVSMTEGYTKKSSRYKPLAFSWALGHVSGWRRLMGSCMLLVH